jgi:hypothetical protein
MAKFKIDGKTITAHDNEKEDAFSIASWIAKLFRSAKTRAWRQEKKKKDLTKIEQKFKKRENVDK